MRTEATKRVALVFSLLDADGNGVLEADDFELMAGRVVEAAPDADEAAKDAMRTAFRGYWTTLRREADANGDGEITFEEYAACVLSPERFDATIDAFAEALAALGDPGGDGTVERPAFVALMTAIGFERANIDALFDAFGPSDADRIQVATWVDGIKDYYAPGKAGIPGDHLVVGTAV
ncbi:EF-hand domain-containing protein [Streptomyces botrytidirepellens]|uniref:Calcium-binding protein n=1 Tax=Streptomyces botrytidirepellens TaxID=2486417 RepID=A0A3M8TLD9_9ACTN|nr:EF-hand domain-containing protein [Streptomyces botrytidirepellens]RNF93905.1 calcium-binding protein [Streptomyces botrytidirepellens]